MSTVYNRKARFNYEIIPHTHMEAGISLTGGEAKSVREGRADLSRSVVRITSAEAYLINANIPVEGAKDFNSTRTRKLLLHRSQIGDITVLAKQRKLTIVPISLYTKGRLVKLELALGKPKRKFEKKESIKAKDIQRDIDRELKGKD